MIPTNPDLLGKSVGVTGVACSVLLGITVILLVLNAATAKTLPWHNARTALWLCKARYLLAMCFLECRYRFRMLILKLGYLRVRVNQCLMNYKLVLLYLLDKRACLSVLRELNESSKKLADFGNRLKCSHNSGHIVVKPNVEVSDQRGREKASDCKPDSMRPL